ncbi:MAG: hypothetical protein CMJ18_12795 [Phycisphaeraceae bacterium]|nr:hypothetical protein [Phycisphaeraceae bacterium]
MLRVKESKSRIPDRYEFRISNFETRTILVPILLVLSSATLASDGGSAAVLQSGQRDPLVERWHRSASGRADGNEVGALHVFVARERERIAAQGWRRDMMTLDHDPGVRVGYHEAGSRSGAPIGEEGRRLFLRSVRDRFVVGDGALWLSRAAAEAYEAGRIVGGSNPLNTAWTAAYLELVAPTEAARASAILARARHHAEHGPIELAWRQYRRLIRASRAGRPSGAAFDALVAEVDGLPAPQDLLDDDAPLAETDDGSDRSAAWRKYARARARLWRSPGVIDWRGVDDESLSMFADLDRARPGRRGADASLDRAVRWIGVEVRAGVEADRRLSVAGLLTAASLLRFVEPKMLIDDYLAFFDAPDHGAALLRFVRFAFDAHRRDVVKAALDRLVTDVRPDDLRALSRAATWYVRVGERERAAALYQRVAGESAPAEEQIALVAAAHLHLAALQRSVGDQRRTWERAAARFADRPEGRVAQYRLAVSHFSDGQFDVAQRIVDGLRPRCAGRDEIRKVALLSGQVAIGLHELDRALEQFQWIIERYPVGPDAAKTRFLEAWIHMVSNREEEAIASLRKLLEDHPPGPYHQPARDLLNKLQRSSGD